VQSESTAFGSYRLVELLGEGAMGEVWRAMDLRLEREVALKILKDADDVRRRALISEAKLACQLNHPNIAHIYDAGEIEGTPYIAMELVEGHNLRSEVGDKAPEALLMRIARQAGSALNHAHQKGVVHRDIKPENLVMTPEGQLKILDFGIARRDSEPTSGKQLTHHRTSQQTAHHMTLIERTSPGYSQGTPAYMSPEQANGKMVTGASDQFSLGTVLYELAAARHPFLRDSLVETLYAVAKDEPPPLNAVRKDLTPGLVRAIHKLLAKKPETRFQDLETFLAVLEDNASTERVEAISVARSRTFWWKLSAALLLVSSTVGLGAWFWSKRSNALNADPGSGLSAARLASQQDLAKGRKVVAILPLEQLRPDPEHSWLSNSFADAMAFGLSSREDLLVLDRLKVGEAMQRLGDEPGRAPKALEALGRALKAELLVFGSYQVAGERTRLVVRIINVASGTTEHQFQLERPSNDMLKLEDDLQQQLPKELGLGRESGFRARARNPRTRELYTKANLVLTEGNLEALKLSQSLFNAAIELEPDYAPARAGLAWNLEELGASVAISQGRFEEGQKLFLQAKIEAEKAIQLDPGLGEAYRALSAALLRLNDNDGASRAALQALRLDPADSRAYDVLADTFAGLEGAENHQTARSYFEKSLALYPDNWRAHHRLGVLLQNDGALQASLDHSKQAIALRPTAELAYVTASDALIWMGRSAEAEAMLHTGMREVPGSAVMKQLLAYTLWERGDKESALKWIRDSSGAWPADSSNAVFQEGLKRSLEGDDAGMLTVFRTFGERLVAEKTAGKKHNERRVLSVNLYFMARSLARKGHKDAAAPLLDLAEQFHSGKRLVAQQDPAFK
jgi:serine/threonine protein kinase/tetratricopeptide (TPR) repeat protein